ncbi:MAG: hypothetical protein KGL12_13890 [Rhodospirillales bacterium]|nr:hypothetical protein [Rhodospirillales bacterium]
MPMQTLLAPFNLTGEDVAVARSPRAGAFDWLRIAFGLILVYDSWTSLSVADKTEFAHLMGLPMSSGLLHLTVIALTFLKIALAAALLTGRGLKVMGWVGVGMSLAIWIVVQHGGDFGPDGTDPGAGAAYLVAFLFVLAAERAKDVDIAHNETFSLARVAFGMLWAYDALYKFQPYFLTHYLDFLTAAKADAGGGLQAGYDQLWIAISLLVGPGVMAWIVAMFEAVTAIGLLAGHRSLRALAPIGFALAFVIWSVPEEFGGPFHLGVGGGPTHMFGTAIIYMLCMGYVMMVYSPRDLFGFAPRRHPLAS